MQKTEIATETGWEEEIVASDIDAVIPKNEPQPIDDIPVSIETQVAQPQEALLDASDRVAPNLISADKPMWRHPAPRAALAFFGVGMIGIAFTQLTQGNNPTVSNAQPPTATAQSPTQSPTPSVAGAENGELQSRLATVILSQKLEKIKAERTDANTATKPTKVVKPTPTQNPQPTPVAAPPPRQVVVYRSPPQVSPPRAFPPQIQPQQQQQPSVELQQQAKESVDPQKQWLATAEIGSYGQISNDSNTQSFEQNTADATTNGQYQTTNNSDPNSLDLPSGGSGSIPASVNQVASNQGNYQPTQLGASYRPTQSRLASGGNGSIPASVNQVASTQNIYRPTRSVAQSSNISNSIDSRYQTVSYSHPSLSLVVGTKAAGKLQTPIAWSGDLQNQNQNFLVQLSEPLKASDGSILIQKGGYLVARVGAAQRGGIIQMSAVSYLSTHNNRTIEQPLPQDAILILGKGGKPLQAKSSRKNNTGTNAGMVLLSGASTAAGLVNQATSQSFLGSGGSFSTTTTSPNPDYVAGFGQGVADGLVQQIQHRSQRARQQIESQPNVYVLNQGTSVQIFVNSSVSL